MNIPIPRATHVSNWFNHCKSECKQCVIGVMPLAGCCETGASLWKALVEAYPPRTTNKR